MMATRNQSSADRRLRATHVAREHGERPDSPYAMARAMVGNLNRRHSFFGQASFGDPQWMMLLELFAASGEGREVSVSSLCFASGVPATTALRHIRSLVANGLCERYSHPRDRRICYVRLTDAARNQMIGYFLSVATDGHDLDEGPTLRAAH
jgi:DNA-binding MarR family transcriptional regulator